MAKYLHLWERFSLKWQVLATFTAASLSTNFKGPYCSPLTQKRQISHVQTRFQCITGNPTVTFNIPCSFGIGIGSVKMSQSPRLFCSLGAARFLLFYSEVCPWNLPNAESWLTETPVLERPTSLLCYIRAAKPGAPSLWPPRSFTTSAWTGLDLASSVRALPKYTMPFTHRSPHEHLHSCTIISSYTLTTRAPSSS